LGAISGLPSTGGDVPQFPILVGTHHKTGTIWMHDTFQRIAMATGLRLGVLGSRGEAHPSDIYIAHHSQFPREMLRGTYRGLHLIRDPRDIVISGMFYHLKSDEPWLHTPRPTFAGLTYQQTLNALDPEDRFAFELKNAASWTIEELLLWRYTNPRFYEARYEDMIVDTEGSRFASILAFLGFDEPGIRIGIEVFVAASIFGKARKVDDQHIRSGKREQWKQFYRQRHGRLFVDRFHDCLVRLGYEPDNEWVDRLPP
jgi:hypothetical protein